MFRGGLALAAVLLPAQIALVRGGRALLDFAKRQTGQAGRSVARVLYSPIEMSLDTLELAGRVQAGSSVKLLTRKARKGDCICSNESAYYPPLARVEFFAPGITIDGEVSAGPLGSRWSIPDSRSAYMATFQYE